MKMMEVKLDTIGIRQLLRSQGMRQLLSGNDVNVRVGTSRAVSFPKKSSKQSRRSKYINDYKRRKQRD